MPCILDDIVHITTKVIIELLPSFVKSERMLDSLFVYCGNSHKLLFVHIVLYTHTLLVCLLLFCLNAN